MKHFNSLVMPQNAESDELTAGQLYIGARRVRASPPGGWVQRRLVEQLHHLWLPKYVPLFHLLGIITHK